MLYSFLVAKRNKFIRLLKISEKLPPDIVFPSQSLNTIQSVAAEVAVAVAVAVPVDFKAVALAALSNNSIPSPSVETSASTLSHLQQILFPGASTVQCFENVTVVSKFLIEANPWRGDGYMSALAYLFPGLYTEQFKEDIRKQWDALSGNAHIRTIDDIDDDDVSFA